MTSSNFVDRYTGADLFDRTFAMIRRTWKTSLGIGATVFAIPSLLLGWAAVRTVGSIARLIESTGPYAGVEIVWAVLRSVGIMPVAATVLGIAYLFAQLVVTDAVRAEALEGSHTLNASVQKTLRRNLLPVVGQALIKGALFGLLIGVPVAILTAGIALTDGSTVVVIGAVVLYLASLAVSAWLFVALFFGQHAIVFDGTEVMAGLRESMRLVRGSWWRVLGLYLLLQIVLSFLVGLVSTPVVGASMLPSIARLVDAASSQPLSDAQVARVLSSLSGLGVGAVIASLVQQLITLLIVPVYYALLYIDLKVRSGDLSPSVDGGPDEGDGTSRGHEPSGASGPAADDTGL